MKKRKILSFSLLAVSKLFALTDPNSPSNPNYPQVQIDPLPLPKLKLAKVPKEIPTECRLSVPVSPGANPVEITLNEFDKGFPSYSVRVCLTESNDVDVLLDIFRKGGAPTGENANAFVFWKNYSDYEKELVVLCVVNKNKKFCEVTLNELQQDALVYHDRTKAIETEFILSGANILIPVKEEFDIEFTADALQLRAQNEAENLRLRLYFQK